MNSTTNLQPQNLSYPGDQPSTSLCRPLHPHQNPQGPPPPPQQQQHPQQPPQFHQSQPYYNNYRNPPSNNPTTNNNTHGAPRLQPTVSASTIANGIQKINFSSSSQSTTSSTLPPPSIRYSSANGWQQNHFDSGFHSATQSGAPSIMSFAGSEMSLTSVMTMDIPATQISEQTKRRIERVQTFFTASDPVRSKEALPELIQLLNDSDEDVVTKSIEMLKKIFRSDNFRPPHVSAVVNEENVVFAVQSVMMKHRKNKYIVHCCLCIFFYTSEDNLVSLIKEHKEDVLDTAISCLNQTEHVSYKYALLLIDTLVRSKEIGATVVNYIREHKALTYIVPWLSYPRLDDKLISITVDIIYHICHINEEQRSFFVINHEGIVKLIKILSERCYLPMVDNIAKLLHSIAIADKEKPNYSKKIVEAGIYRVIPKFLNASPDYIFYLLRLVKDLGDIRDNSDLRPLLHYLILKIDYPDLKVKQLAVECLANLIANHAKNKEFLVEHNALPAIVKLMMETNNADDSHKRYVEKIHESAIRILSHICVKHARADYVVKTIPQTELRFILLTKLIELRPAVLKPTLTLLSRLTAHQTNVPIFLTTRIGEYYHERWYIPEICRILKVAFNQIFQTVEDVQIYILVHLALNILTKFCADETAIESIFACLGDVSMGGPLIPICVLQAEVPGENLDNVKLSSLDLIQKLAKSVMGARYFSTDEYSKQLLMMLRSQPMNEASQKAEKILDQIKETIRNPQPPQPLPMPIQQPPMYNYGPPPPPPYIPPPPHGHPMQYPHPPPASYGQPGPYQPYHEPTVDPYAYPHPSTTGGADGEHQYYGNPTSLPPPPAYDPMSVEPSTSNIDGPRHEELAYPVEEIQYPTTSIYPPPQSISTTTAPPMDDYGSMAPQTSPYQDSMQWK